MTEVSVSQSSGRAYRRSDYRNLRPEFCQLSAARGADGWIGPQPEGPFRPLTEDLLSSSWIREYPSARNLTDKVSGQTRRGRVIQRGDVRLAIGERRAGEGEMEQSTEAVGVREFVRSNWATLILVGLALMVSAFHTWGVR